MSRQKGRQNQANRLVVLSGQPAGAGVVWLVGAWPGDDVSGPLEESDGEVIGLGLHVLRKRQERRPTRRRIEHRRNGVR